MKTKLEMMVAYLAGRQGEAAGSIRRELEDPSSEASRWLEALRSRSGGILGAARRRCRIPSPLTRSRAGRTHPGWPGDGRLCSSSPRPSRWCSSRWMRRGGRKMAASAASRRRCRGARRGGETASTASRRPSRAGRHLAKGEPLRPKATNPQEVRPPTPADQPTSLALARIEARLGELGQRLEAGQAGRDQDDQRVAEVRRDLDRLRQEAGTAGRASRQEGQELAQAVREILQLLRRLASQSGTMETMPVPVTLPVLPPGHGPRVGQGPGMIPEPGPGQLQGPAHMQRPPGRGNH